VNELKEKEMAPEVSIQYKNNPDAKEEFIRFIVEYFLNKDIIHKVGDD